MDGRASPVTRANLTQDSLTQDRAARLRLSGPYPEENPP